ncbi:MAG: hypothetical protein NZ522_00555 [Chitinophagales bacterium]|nr:hypothetical protein [Chitinophagales bacterium]
MLIILRNKVNRLFAWFAFFSYLLFAILQNVSITEKYGLSIITVNVVMILMVAYVWLLELKQPLNNYGFKNINLIHTPLIALAMLAFWFPLDNGELNFTLNQLLYNGSSLTFCMMTPVFLTIMTVNFPQVNPITYRVTALIGAIIGFYNMLNFADPKLINLALLHLPLVIISVHALFKSYFSKDRVIE